MSIQQSFTYGGCSAECIASVSDGCRGVGDRGDFAVGIVSGCNRPQRGAANGGSGVAKDLTGIRVQLGTTEVDGEIACRTGDGYVIDALKIIEGRFDLCDCSGSKGCIPRLSRV